MKKNTTNTAATRNASTAIATENKPVMMHHNPGTYHGKVDIDKYECYVPGTCTAPAKKSVSRETQPENTQPATPANKPGKAAVQPVNKPENVKPGKSTANTEKPVKSVPGAVLNQSQPNTETHKPGIREKARENMKEFRDNIRAYIKASPDNGRDVVDYSDTMPGLYRLYARINGKRKCFARIKAQRDVYVLVREEVAKAAGYKKDSPGGYALITYNLPAGIHVDYTDIPGVIETLYDRVED